MVVACVALDLDIRIWPCPPFSLSLFQLQLAFNFCLVFVSVSRPVVSVLSGYETGFGAVLVQDGMVAERGSLGIKIVVP